jgi:protein SCO1/2
LSSRILQRSFLVLTGVLLGLAVVLVVLPSGDGSTAVGELGYFLSDPIPAPAFSLDAHNGTRFDSQEAGNQHLIVFFGYTYCPDVCPLNLSNLARAFQEMGENAEAFQVLLVTVDPYRDSPKRLEEYLSNFHSSFLGLIGSEEEIRSVAEGFGAFFAKVGEGPDYTVDHTARMFVVSPAGEIPLTFPVTATPSEMARDLALLLDLRS